MIFLLGCQPEKNKLEKEYAYSDDFRMYLKNIFKEEIKRNCNYFVIPLNSCGQCVDSALYKLTTNKFNWTIIFTGQTEDSLRQHYILQAKLRYIYFNDSTSALSEYSVGIGLPTLLETNDAGNVKSKLEFSYADWKSFKF